MRFWERVRAALGGGPSTIDCEALFASCPAPPPTAWPRSDQPYVRWWWLRGPFREEDIAWQLGWVAAQGFGGVELAWLLPTWLSPDPEREAATPGWLSAEWTARVTEAKRHAERLGLGFDLTLGSCWPFGGSCVPAADASQSYDGPSRDLLHGSWEERDQPRHALRLLDHLDAGALARYVQAHTPALAPALTGQPVALFCDSLELDKDRLWRRDLDRAFAERCGRPRPDCGQGLPRDPAVRYELRRLLGETIVPAFYAALREACAARGALARVQCHGAPADLLAAYGAVDIPESETLLFPPHFSRIPASAAAVSGAAAVSCETFTCIYGLARPGCLAPMLAWGREQLADLRLLADAVFAHGVNQIVWHGMPYNGPGGTDTFFASVHVAPDCAFAAELAPFNAYLTRVSRALKLGRAHCGLGVYLPNEDCMRRPDDYAEGERTPGEQDRWEMRQVTVPEETEGYAPLWVSGHALAAARVREDGAIQAGALRLPALYVDVETLAPEALAAILKLAQAGARCALLRAPRPPGLAPSPDYAAQVRELQALRNVRDSLAGLQLEPLLEALDGGPLPFYWARRLEQALLVFLAHPWTREIRYPLQLGASAAAKPVTRRLRWRTPWGHHDTRLTFRARDSLLVRLSPRGVERVDLGYTPPPPRVHDRGPAD